MHLRGFSAPAPCHFPHLRRSRKGAPKPEDPAQAQTFASDPQHIRRGKPVENELRISAPRFTTRFRRPSPRGIRARLRRGNSNAPGIAIPSQRNTAIQRHRKTRSNHFSFPVFPAGRSDRCGAAGSPAAAERSRPARHWATTSSGSTVLSGMRGPDGARSHATTLLLSSPTTSRTACSLPKSWTWLGKRSISFRNWRGVGSSASADRPSRST